MAAIGAERKQAASQPGFRSAPIPAVCGIGIERRESTHQQTLWLWRPPIRVSVTVTPRFSAEASS